MIQCKKCKANLQKPSVFWEVIFHGSLIKQDGKIELEPSGESDYIHSLSIECNSSGNIIEIKIDEEEITDKNLNRVVRKFTGIKK